MAKKKSKPKPTGEATGNVEPHPSGWRARVWQNKKNQRGPIRRHYEEAEHDLIMVRGGFPIQRLYEPLKPTTEQVEQHGNSYRVRFCFGLEKWRTPCRPTRDEAEADLKQFETKGVLDLSLARGRQRRGTVTNADVEASLAVALG